MAAILRREGFRLDRWHVEPRRNRLAAEGEDKAVDPKLMDMLVSLAARAPRVVDKDELLEAVWEGAFVSENTVAQAVSRLRKALGDDPRQPRYVETIPKVGYRLVAEVRALGPSAVVAADFGSPAARPETAGEPGRRSGKRAAVPLYVALAAVGLLISIVVASLTIRRPAPGLQVHRVIPESTQVGNQFEPSLSPDGRHLAFAWYGPEQEDWDLWIQPVGGDGPVRLTDDPAAERLPAWSPDGESVAFVRFGGEPPACGVFRIPAVGGRAERIGDCLDGMRFLDWSPDGKSLVTNARVGTDQVTAIFLLDVETGAARQVTNPPARTLGDRYPSFSPDGSRLAFTRVVTASRHDVMVLALSGAGAGRPLTRDAWGQIRGVEWTRDGSSVVYSSNRDGRYSLWRLPLTGGTPVHIPIQDQWVTQPSLAAETGELIYRTFRDAVDLWELPLDAAGAAAGEPVRRLASTRNERQPLGSPDGTRVAFVSDRTGSLELWSGAGDGSELMRHTDLSGPQPGSLAWSPDGARLVYDAAVHGHADLWSVAADSRRPVRLTTDPSDERNPSFSADGRSIYFGSNRSGGWEIWRMPAAGGLAEQVTAGGGFLAQEDPAGESVYYVRLDEPGIWRQPVAGGAPVAVLDGLGLADWGSWLVEERGLWFVTRGPTAIAFLGFGAEEPRVVFAPPKQMPYLSRTISLSSDRRALWFEMIDHSDDEIMRAEVDGL